MASRLTVGGLSLLDLGCSTASGGGEVFLLLHGIGGCARNFLPSGRLLADHGRTVAVDLPAHGHSPSPGSWSLDAVLDMLHPVITEVASWGERLTLVGHSLGGLLACEIAARDEASIHRLVLVSSPLPTLLSMLTSRGAWARHVGLAMRFTHAMAISAVHPPAFFCRDLNRGGPSRFVLAPFLRPNRVRANRSTGTAIAGQGGVTALKLLSITPSLQPLAAIRRLRRPPQVILGQCDPLLTLADFRTVIEVAGNRHVRVIRNAGHWPHVEAPAEVVRALLP